MKYVSTRGGGEPQSFTSIVLSGLAKNGGLMVPESLPYFRPEDIEAMRGYSYQQLAFAIMRPFMDDISPEGLGVLVNKTYSEQVFGSKEITPVSRIGLEEYLLHLSEGPTASFKDIALQFLGNLFEYILEKENRNVTILGATSGDTGSAAMHALKGKKNVDVFILFPEGKVSLFQQSQMTTLTESNIFPVAIKGTFDDCQNAMKAVNKDEWFREHFNLSAINSVNWDRVKSQMVYYFKGYYAISRPGGVIDVTIPSGNSGNLMAGYYAKQMGLPIRNLIVATNENDVLDVFFNEGIYRRKNVVETNSPSMDIQVSSNLERLLYEIVGRDPEMLRQMMEQFGKEGIALRNTKYWNALQKMGIKSGSATAADRKAAIQSMYHAEGMAIFIDPYTAYYPEKMAIIIDPHTANALHVGRKYKEGGVPMLYLETARPFKFDDAIKDAIGIIPDRPARFQGIEKLKQRYHTLPNDPEAVKNYIRKATESAFSIVS